MFLNRVLTVALAVAVPLTAYAVLGTAPPTVEADAPPPASPALAGSPASHRPNLVLVTVDDMAATDLRWMPRTRRLLGDHGMTFRRALSPHPLCCPARAALLTGQYAQNNGVHHNDGPWGGYRALDASSTLATWLRRAGYRTAFHGKYLNLYNRSEPGVEPGWTYWDALDDGIYRYRDFTFRNHHGPRAHYPEAYLTDVLARRSARSIRRFSGRRPFFLWISHVAPHDSKGVRGWGPPIPARRHADLFAGRHTPTRALPTFNTVRPSMPGSWRQRSPVSPAGMDALFRARIRSLQAVDQATARLLRVLRAERELGNTWIVFTSDNGFALGQHRHAGKDVLTRDVMGVPLLVRGPGVAKDTASRVPVTLVDVPVTFADLAGVRPGLRVDGRSIVRLLRGERQGWRDTQLIQTGSPAGNGWGWRGVATRRYTYARRGLTGAELLFDHRRDPWETVNRARRPGYADEVAELRHRLRVLHDCAGRECRRSFGPVS